MRKKLLIKVFLLTITIILVVMGLISGEFQVVWQKARTVCLECVGLG